MTKTALRLSCLCLGCLVVAACGGTSTRTVTSTSNRQQIAGLFNGMYTAFAQGNYGQVCTDMSQRQQDTIVSGARKAGLNVSSCTDALTTLLRRAGISKEQVAEAFGASGIHRKLDSVQVHGNQATVTFTETEQGQTSVETDALVREGGRWRADRVLKRSQSG
jgi:hypothetical protein